MTPHPASSSNLPVLIACWSAKGGTGTSVFAAVLALCLSRSVDTVLIDAAGDQQAIFDVDAPAVGFVQWMDMSTSASEEALSRLAIAISPSLRLIPNGDGEVSGSGDPEVATRIRSAFPTSCIVVDAGTLRDSSAFRAGVAIAADHSLSVVRPCYLSAQRTLQCDIRRDGVVVVDEPGRVLTTKDLQSVLGNSVYTTFQFDPALARMVDAGRITRRLPRSTRNIERLAESLLVREVARAS